MKDKYIARQIGNEAEGFVFAIVYTPPKVHNGPGVVTLGGPDRWRENMLNAVDVVRGCCAGPPDARPVMRLGARSSWPGAAKSRWQLEDVAVREWKDALVALRRQGFALEGVTRLGGLMW